MCDYDETQSIGRRYRRQDEIGTPWCVTVDFDSLEDQAVTVRDRDTTEQVRVPIDGAASRRSTGPSGRLEAAPSDGPARQARRSLAASRTTRPAQGARHAVRLRLRPHAPQAARWS